MKEIWVDIKDFEGRYQVSNFGRIKSLYRIKVRRRYGAIAIPEKVLSPHVDSVGYKRFYLYNEDYKIREFVHRIVAKTFIENPDNKPNVNHKNGDKLDNRVENLEWCTQKENIQHSFKTELQIPYKGEECSFSKLKESDVLKIREMWKTNKYTQKEIGEMFSVTRGAIKNITLNKNWRHLV